MSNRDKEKRERNRDIFMAWINGAKQREICAEHGICPAVVIKHIKRTALLLCNAAGRDWRERSPVAIRAAADDYRRMIRRHWA